MVFRFCVRVFLKVATTFVLIFTVYRSIEGIVDCKTLLFSVETRGLRAKGLERV